MSRDLDHLFEAGVHAHFEKFGVAHRAMAVRGLPTNSSKPSMSATAVRMPILGKLEVRTGPGQLAGFFLAPLRPGFAGLALFGTRPFVGIAPPLALALLRLDSVGRP